VDLKLGHHAKDGIEVIDIRGEIDMYTAPRLRELLIDLVRRAPPTPHSADKPPPLTCQSHKYSRRVIRGNGPLSLIERGVRDQPAVRFQACLITVHGGRSGCRG